ncbi:MAG: hypothetical protein V1856_00905 [Candidatus Liptonbacteria bacterium]
MKTTSSVFVLLSVLAIPAAAQEIGVKFSTELLSSYVAPIGLEPHGGTVSQSSITFSLPRGFYADLWGSTGLDFEPNPGREIDWTLGWTKGGVDVGVAYFDFDTLFSGRKGDICRFYSRYTRTLPVKRFKLEAYGKAEYYHSTVEPSRNSAHLVGGGLAPTFAFSGGRFSLTLNADVSHVGRVLDHPSGLLLQTGGRLGVKAGRFTLYPLILKSSVPLAGAEQSGRHLALGAGIGGGG